MSKMLLHLCRRCGYKSNYCYEWSNHLLEYRHQTEARKSFIKWSHEDDVKSFVVYAHVDDKPVVVAEKFRSLSVLVDFVFWTNRPGLFIVQLESQEDADIILNNLRMNPDELKIGGRHIQLRRKSDVLQNEWTILIGYGTEEEGSSKEPICIELSDECSGDETQMDVKEGSADNKGVHNGNGSDSAEMEVDYSITTEMSSTFSKTFLSKLKPEKKGDNKKNVRENIRFMGKTWMDLYLEFHNKIWPICFSMRNTDVDIKNKPNSNDTDEILEVSFRGECLMSGSKDNDWLAKSKSLCKDNDARKEFVLEKVNEFHEILMNETLCNRKLTQLSTCSIQDEKKCLLSFSCAITVSYNRKGAKAELSFSNIEGKSLNTKMRLVTSIFKKLFKKYEKMRIDKWSLAQSFSNGVVHSGTWTQMVSTND
ncbi:unnamed protein product [Orchesella dallaii]|uniref:Uncharacterized protein n=1 Tax=Orchesella dallaii TaxID=48710 RepID=A0ABP1PLS6_9HEXA